MTDPRVAVLAAALRKAFPSKRASQGSAGVLAAATILAALPPDWCGHEAEMARLRKIDAGVAEICACFDGMGMRRVGDGGWVVPQAGHEKFQRAMDVLAGLTGKP
jgi:hypothetical protein